MAPTVNCPLSGLLSIKLFYQRTTRGRHARCGVHWHELVVSEELLVTSCPGRPLLARCKAGFPF